MRVGIDIGGTKIEIVVLDSAGQVQFVERIKTPTDSYAEFLTALDDLIRRAEKQAGTISNIGIGCPGAISADTQRIKNANCQILNGHNLASDIAERFGVPVKIANDADCLALSEFKDGAAKEAESSCFAAILGTGCGGGLVINGELVTGVNRIAGEWGHNPLPDWDKAEDGPLHNCYCSRGRCQESFISGTGFARNFQAIYGRQADAQQIVAWAREGDKQAEQHLKRFFDQLARALAAVINVIDPEVIVLGGGLSNLNEIYTEVPAIWQKYIFSDSVYTKLVKASHGDSSGVRGAAWL